MTDLLMIIIGNRTFFAIGTYYCIPITIAVIVMFFVKSSRDERGRAILGKASIISTIAFIIFINIFARISMQVPMEFDSIACFIQWIYNIVLTIQVVAILIYKRIE